MATKSEWKRINRFKQLIAEYEWQDIYGHLNANIVFGKFHERLKLAYDSAIHKMQIRKYYNTKNMVLRDPKNFG